MNRSKFETRVGRHGTLYRFLLTYRDESEAGNNGRTGVWAYDAEHAIEKFYDSADADGWKVERVERARVR